MTWYHCTKTILTFLNLTSCNCDICPTLVYLPSFYGILCLLSFEGIIIYCSCFTLCASKLHSYSTVCVCVCVCGCGCVGGWVCGCVGGWVCGCGCVPACLRACLRVCVCLFPSTVEASTDWSKTNVMPEIRPAMLCWRNHFVSSTFITIS